MKLSVFVLPILTEAQRKNPRKNQKDKSPGKVRTLTQCSEQPGFTASGNGDFQGTLNLERYAKEFDCFYDIQAASSCNQIRITAESIAVELTYDGCEDYFQFESNEEITSQQCGFLGEGKDTEFSYETENDGDYELSDYYLDLSEEELDAWFSLRHGLTFDSNQVKFKFHSDHRYFSGHVRLNWECTDRAPQIDQSEGLSSCLTELLEQPVEVSRKGAQSVIAAARAYRNCELIANNYDKVGVRSTGRRPRVMQLDGNTYMARFKLLEEGRFEEEIVSSGEYEDCFQGDRPKKRSVLKCAGRNLRFYFAGLTDKDLNIIIR